MKIAVAQIPISDNAWNNFRTIGKYLKEASEQKVKLVLFPETALIRNQNKKELAAIPFQVYLQKIQTASEDRPNNDTQDKKSA